MWGRDVLEPISICFAMLFEDIVLVRDFVLMTYIIILEQCVTVCMFIFVWWINSKAWQSYITQALNENYPKSLIHKFTSWWLTTTFRLYASETLEYICYHKATSSDVCPYYTECKNNHHHMKRMSSYRLPLMVELSRERKQNDVILMKFQMKK